MRGAPFEKSTSRCCRTRCSGSRARPRLTVPVTPRAGWRDRTAVRTPPPRREHFPRRRRPGTRLLWPDWPGRRSFRRSLRSRNARDSARTSAGGPRCADSRLGRASTLTSATRPTQRHHAPAPRRSPPPCRAPLGTHAPPAPIRSNILPHGTSTETLWLRPTLRVMVLARVIERRSVDTSWERSRPGREHGPRVPGSTFAGWRALDCGMPPTGEFGNSCSELVTWVVAEQAQRSRGRVGQSDPFIGALPPGTRVGRYQVLGAIGRGGMGEVYAAYHPISIDGSRSRWCARRRRHAPSAGRGCCARPAPSPDSPPQRHQRLRRGYAGRGSTSRWSSSRARPSTVAARRPRGGARSSTSSSRPGGGSRRRTPPSSSTATSNPRTC